MKFKVGDQVRYIAKDYGTDYFNQKGTLTKIETSGTFGHMRVDKNNLEICGDLATEIALIEENAQDPTPSPESETKVLTDKIAKMEKQVKLLKLMLESQGYNALAIASALELLD